MGLFDQIGSALGGKLGEGQHNGLLDSAIDLIGNSKTGGLAGLAQTFKERGLGDAMSSWISTGENQQVSGDQIHRVLGSERIQHIADKSGTSPQETSNGLAGLLPQIIDKLTPNGALQKGGLSEQGLGLLKDKLFGR